VTRRSLLALLASWWLLLGVLNAVWLVRDTRPPTWDPANHLNSWISYRNALEDWLGGSRGLAATVSRILRRDDHYPPLSPLTAALLSLPFPPKPDVPVLLLDQVALAILLVAVFLLGRDLGDEQTGALAAAAASSFVLIAIWCHTFMLDLAETAMTALVVLLLWRSDEFRRRRTSCALGVALGLALLTKWTCLLFLLLPFAYSLWRALRRVEAGRLHRLTNAALVLALALLIALPWYSDHLWNLARDFSIFGYRVGAEEGDPPVFSVRSFLYYARGLAPAILLPWVGLFLVGVFSLFRSRSRLKPILFLWLIGGWTILTLIRNKDERYLMAMLPAVALVATAWLSGARIPARVRIAVVGLLVLLSLGLSWRRDPPRKERWRVAEAVDYLRSRATSFPAPRIRVVPDCPFFERHAFELYAGIARLPLDVGGWYNFPAFTDFVVTKTGSQGGNPRAEALARQIEGGGDFDKLFKVKWEAALPDGTAGRIYEREISPVPVPADAVIARLELSCLALATKHLQDIQGWRFEVAPYSEEETRRGHFRRVSLHAESAAFSTLRVSSLGVEAGDVVVNPYRLLRDEDLEVLHLGEATPRLSVSEAEVNRYLRSRLRGTPAGIEFRNGSLRAFRGRSELELRLELVAASNIRFEIQRVRLGGLPIPAFLVQFLAHGNNPILRPMPCRIRLESLQIENGVLAVNE
jgi:hypothetical protein